MNIDDILNMPAGEWMDTLVAEKVMHWHMREPEYGGSRKQWVDENGRYEHMASSYDGYEDAEDFETICWHPSESILWAWEVVEKLHIHTLRRVMNKKPDSDSLWQASIYKNPSLAGIGETAALAICRAALIAVMIVDPKLNRRKSFTIARNF